MLSMVGGDVGSGIVELGGVDLVKSFQEGLKVLIVP